MSCHLLSEDVGCSNMLFSFIKLRERVFLVCTWIFVIGGYYLISISIGLGFFVNNLSALIIMGAFISIVVFSKLETLALRDLLIFTFFFLSVFISILSSSEAFRSGFRDKVYQVIVFSLVPSISGLLVCRTTSKIKTFRTLLIINLLLTLFVLSLSFTKLPKDVSWYRLSSDAASIGFSKSIMFSFILILIYCVIEKKLFLTAVFIILGLFSTLITSTRQAFAGFVFFLLLLLMFNLFSRKAHLRFKVLVLLLVCLMIPLLFSIDLSDITFNNRALNLFFSTGVSRWQVFLESGIDSARSMAQADAFDAFSRSPIFGVFYYETPGFFAHNLVFDSLGQYGMIGTFILMILVFRALFVSIKLLVCNTSLIDQFIGYGYLTNLFIAFTVSTFLLNYGFFFMLAYLNGLQKTTLQNYFDKYGRGSEMDVQSGK